MILNTIQAQHIDLVVISSHSEAGFKRWAMGSVSQKVARHAAIPVLVLRSKHDTASTGPHPYIERPLRILVPLDGSVTAKAALKPAAYVIAALATPGEGAIHLTRVINLKAFKGDAENNKELLLQKAKKYLSAISEHLQEGIAGQLKLPVTWSVAIDSDAAAAIIRVAENGEDAEGAGVFGGCDFIAISTHGRGGLQRWALGSVTERIIQGTKLPLLIVHPSQTEEGAGHTGAER